ncbi:MAG: hypothetical protein WCI18_13165 [Pseudomonadota bacterium]
MKSRILCAVFCGISSMSIAAGVSENGRSQAKVTTSKAKAFLACTNFSGTWRGSCVAEGATEPTEDLVIAQEDCVSINLGGETIPFGQEVVITDGSTTRYTRRMGWDANFNAIQLSAKLETKWATEPDSTFKIALTAEGTFEISNGELISKVTSTSVSSENNSPSTFHEICTYKKI